MEPLRILGVDPGLNVTGYAVIDSSRHASVVEAGVIRPTKGREASDMAGRLKALYDSLIEIIDQLRPGVLVIEALYSHYDHPRTAVLMAHARGAIVLAGAQRGLPVYSYTASMVKKLICGHGRASKEQMQHAMMREFALAALPEPHDVADALAVALSQHHKRRQPAEAA